MIIDLIWNDNQKLETWVNHPVLGSRFKNSISNIRQNNTINHLLSQM